MKAKLLKAFILCILFWYAQAGLSQSNMHHRHKPLPCINKTFSVHVHLTQDPYGQVEFDLEDLYETVAWTNQAFAPICIDFEICSIDTLEDYNWNYLSLGAEIAQMTSLSYEPHVINIFVVKRFSDPDRCSLSSQGKIEDPDKAFLYFTKHCAIIPRVLTHEMGHLFGLFNSYLEQNELVDGSNCITHGDQICDTPADPYYPGAFKVWINNDCEFVDKTKDSLGQYYLPDVGNIMGSYSCSDCGFSYQQLLLMANNWLSSERNMR